MRKAFILFLAAGFTTLVACGGTAETTTEEPKAEEPKAEEPKAEEPKAEEPKAEEPAPAEGEEGEGAAPGTDTVCCKFTNKEGAEVKRNIAKAMCAQKSGTELDAAECPAAPEGGGKRGKH